MTDRSDKRVNCRVVDVDGAPILVRGRGDLTDRDREALAELVDAVKRRHRLAPDPLRRAADRFRREDRYTNTEADAADFERHYATDDPPDPRYPSREDYLEDLAREQAGLQ